MVPCNSSWARCCFLNSEDNFWSKDRRDQAFVPASAVSGRGSMGRSRREASAVSGRGSRGRSRREASAVSGRGSRGRSRREAVRDGAETARGRIKLPSFPMILRVPGDKSPSGACESAASGCGGPCRRRRRPEELGRRPLPKLMVAHNAGRGFYSLFLPPPTPSDALSALCGVGSRKVRQGREGWRF